MVLVILEDLKPLAAGRIPGRCNLGFAFGIRWSCHIAQWIASQKSMIPTPTKATADFPSLSTGFTVTCCDSSNDRWLFAALQARGYLDYPSTK